MASPEVTNGLEMRKSFEEGDEKNLGMRSIQAEK
jgi:hypothetical protein